MEILWLSQHQPLRPHIEELRRLFGKDVQVLQDVNPFSSAEEIFSRYQSGGYDDLVVVAPLSVISRLCELGIKPIWAQMDQLRSIDRDNADLVYRGRCYRFVKFRRIKAVEIVFEEIE